MSVSTKLCRKGKEIEIWKGLSDTQHLHVYLEQQAELPLRGEYAAQKRLSEAEADMEVRNREQKSSGMALCETNRELESQRLELYQANRWADQAQREKIKLCGELEMNNRNFQEHRARDCQEISRITKNLLRRTKKQVDPDN